MLRFFSLIRVLLLLLSALIFIVAFLLVWIRRRWCLFLLLWIVLILVLPLTEHFFLETALFPIDLQNIFCARKVDVVSKADTFQRIFHDSNFIYECSPFVVVNLAVLGTRGGCRSGPLYRLRLCLDAWCYRISIRQRISGLIGKLASWNLLCLDLLSGLFGYRYGLRDSRPVFYRWLFEWIFSQALHGKLHEAGVHQIRGVCVARERIRRFRRWIKRHGRWEIH